MKTLLFLYNPHAGKGQVGAHLATILDAFSKAGWLITVHPTQGPTDATAVAADLGGSFERIVCCGGDGTLHEVVTGLIALEHRPDIGYIPAGSTNDFARNLSLPRGFAALAATAAAGVPLPVDIGRFNDCFFVYVAAFGAFTDVSYDTPQPFKNMFGHLAYVLEGMTRLGSIQSYHLQVEYDGGQLEGDYIFGMVSNTVSVGGLKSPASAGVKLDDGIFELVLIQKPTSPTQLQHIIKSLLQMTQDGSGMVSSLRASRLKILCTQPLPWTLDGEYGGAPKLADIENYKHAVTIVHGSPPKPTDRS